MFTLLFSVCPSFADLIIGGDGANASVIKSFAKHFVAKKKHSSVKIIPTLGSKGGIAALNEGKIQIALITRLLSPAEEAFNLVSVPYAKTCLVFVVHTSTPVQDMDEETFSQIIEGKKTRWADQQLINVIFRSRGDNGAELLTAQFPKLQSSFEKAWKSGMWRTEFRDSKVAELIEKVNGSIGWMDQSEVIASKIQAQVTKLKGISPSIQSIEKNAYPLVNTLAFIYKEPASKDVLEFISLVKSEFGAQILRQYEALPIR